MAKGRVLDTCHAKKQAIKKQAIKKQAIKKQAIKKQIKKKQTKQKDKKKVKGAKPKYTRSTDENYENSQKKEQNEGIAKMMMKLNSTPFDDANMLFLDTKDARTTTTLKGIGLKPENMTIAQLDEREYMQMTRRETLGKTDLRLGKMTDVVQEIVDMKYHDGFSLIYYDACGTAGTNVKADGTIGNDFMKLLNNDLVSHEAVLAFTVCCRTPKIDEDQYLIPNQSAYLLKAYIQELIDRAGYIRGQEFESSYKGPMFHYRCHISREIRWQDTCYACESPESKMLFCCKKSHCRRVICKKCIKSKKMEVPMKHQPFCCGGCC